MSYSLSTIQQKSVITLQLKKNVIAQSSHRKLHQKHLQSSNQTSPEISDSNVSSCLFLRPEPAAIGINLHLWGPPPTNLEIINSQRVIYSMSTEYRIPSHRRKDTCLERLRVQTCRFGLIRRQMHPLN
ncbi:hypothetical protein CDAR_497721 [Caerostris darwini]|uniref:Uncharacterized protein n=1 Tax=Caerostris darwini TaxID=1538125 RepID=A0AAV4PPY0_9ARAC|nr:hypothetical protein CDAR_497721 [Caerostris darwini]